jgi:putative heme-binding domain-containing protein
VRAKLVTTLLICALSCIVTPVTAQTIEQQLQQMLPSDLVNRINADGDPQRGAILFYQSFLSCSKCHDEAQGKRALGPTLTRYDKKPTDELLIEALLEPSKSIRSGYDTVAVLFNDGTQVTGILETKSKTEIVLKDVSRPGGTLTFSLDDIDELHAIKASIMPQGQVNQLASKQQFYDLMRYLFVIRDDGPLAALRLEPPPSLVAARKLPEYESKIDHAGMIGSLDKTSFSRGAVIYNRLCVNCHGDHQRVGSLPTSRRFTKDVMKNGADPFAMYQTLTRGFGLMAPQSWMVPQQKYDVIHYLRETFFRNDNASQYTAVTDQYLATLPAGDTRGPEPSNINKWQQMNYGHQLTATYEVGNDASNFTYKGIAQRLDAGQGGITNGDAFMVFDHDTMRLSAAWQGKGFIDFNGINFNGRHNAHPRLVGEVVFENKSGPGWANPEDGSWDDPRIVGRDGRRYGPLPREWAQYRGLYHHDNQTIISYTVGDVPVLETASRDETADGVVFKRTLNMGKRTRPFEFAVASVGADEIVELRQPASHAKTIRFGPLVVGVESDVNGWKWIQGENGQLRLTIPVGKTTQFTVWVRRIGKSQLAEKLINYTPTRGPDLSTLLRGSAARWSQKIITQAKIGSQQGAFQTDVLQHPVDNPWYAQVRMTGFDFFADSNRMAVSTWDGDVWLVEGVADPLGQELVWQRIATGLFQPLGVKIVNDKIYVGCRDQICVLHDLNGDGETDWYECFNNDHQVTDHFHEFAMGLQRDESGNFYYAKSARHALKAIVPHHGTLLRVSPDGKKTDIIAKGFRAANGVCLNEDGSFIVTDQEGHWNPKNRINWVREGGFYGNMYGYHDVTDSSDAAMEQPLVWITNAFDRSPGELLWVNSKKWGPLNGQLLNLSYGYGKVYVVPHETIDGQVQGGMCELPIAQFPTGVMRGRFHPGNEQLYACGMFAWAGSQTQAGGFYRLRYTGKNVHLPIKVEATTRGMKLTFTDPIEPSIAKDVANYQVKQWALKRTANYGSKHYDEQMLKISGVSLSNDGHSVLIEMSAIKPTWCMEIKYQLQGLTGDTFQGTIHNTIHALSE